VDTETSDAIRSVEFASFMRAYQDMVFSTITRITNSDAHAEDIAQDVFLKAYQHFAMLRTSATAGGWLKTVARNLALNHVSRYRKRWRLFSELRRADDSDDGPELELAAPETLLAGLDADVRHAHVEQALQRLPEHRRLPLVLFHFEDMTYEEIAARLEISVAKVKVDIHRARAKLAQLLARSDISSSGAGQ
jgi:RNA polymerase sigma-70 factor, ECF subfamily